METGLGFSPQVLNTPLKSSYTSNPKICLRNKRRTKKLQWHYALKQIIKHKITEWQEHGEGALRNSCTLSPSPKSNLVFTSAHISAALTSSVMLLPGICQDPETTARWAWNWSQLGQDQPQPCAPWRHRDLAPAAKELTIRAGQDFYIGRANPSWHRRIRSSWRRSQRAEEMRRDGCTWEALMLQDSNVQPLSQKHKRSLRNVGIQLKSCQEAFE